MPRGAFFQTNRHLVSTLARLATSNRSDKYSGTLAWDLYAGVGLFSRALAEHFDQVIAVEASEPAAAALKSALASAPNRKSHRSFAATTLDFLQAAVVQRERPSLILMDPPRAGIGSEVCALLARIRAPELVYVSCDPVTLARDLALLVAAGYEITALHLVDMFPQTFHMETVAILRR
jgi:23S rRNA (uracil1939-C5)-methyltransferase